MSAPEPRHAITRARLLGAALVLLGSLGLVPGEVLVGRFDDHHHGHGVHGDHVHVDESDHHHHDGTDLVDHEHELVDFDCGDAAVVAPPSVVAAGAVAPPPRSAASAIDAGAQVSPHRSRGPPPPHPWQRHKSSIVLTV